MNGAKPTTLTVREARPTELDDWDAQAVDRPGGHVYQSRAWAVHRRRSGWTPRFLVGDDDSRVLALIRRWPVVGGGSAYLPRGPVPMGADPDQLARRLIAVGAFLAGEGIDVVAADPEVPAESSRFRATIEDAGFRAIEEIQPSRHRVTLALGASADEGSIFQAIAKSTRQRIKGAEAAGVAVVRFDTRIGPDGTGPGFSDAVEPVAQALDRFYDLLLETGERRKFTFGPRAGFVAWWQAAHRAGHLVYLEARTGAAESEPLGGLILYRHGGRLSTVHSGDHAELRATHPGALHLLRWRAIQLAIRERCEEMDLGGVDVVGARDEPRPGDPLHGLYQHKISFGGKWLALTGAHERVYDPRGYQLGRLTGRLSRFVGGR